MQPDVQNESTEEQVQNPVAEAVQPEVIPGKKGLEIIRAKPPLMHQLLNRAIVENSPQVDIQKWEDLEDIHMQHAEALVQVAASIQKMTSVSELKLWLPNIPEFNILINGINTDLDSFTNDLLRIKDLRQGRTGNIAQNDDNWVDYLNIFDEYVDFGTRFQAIVIPVVKVITDHVAVAMNRAKAAQLAADAAAVPETPQVEEVKAND